MKAWIAERSGELLIGALCALSAAAFWIFAGPGPIVIWLSLSAVAAPIIGRAINSDDDFDVEIEDEHEQGI